MHINNVTIIVLLLFVSFLETATRDKRQAILLPSLVTRHPSFVTYF